MNRTTESQSDCKDNQWFQNGFNIVIKIAGHTVAIVTCDVKKMIISIFLFADVRHLFEVLNVTSIEKEK